MKKLNAIKEIRSFNRYYTNILGLVDRHILHSPYSLTEVRILYEIFHNPDSTVRKIKNILLVDEGYLSRTIDKLTKRGMITKTQSQIDGRVFILSLTEEGKNEFLKLDKESELSVESIIDHLSPDEISELVSNLRRTKEFLSKKGRGRED
jgi:DNA-binding MarR family transcriptional regulator